MGKLIDLKRLGNWFKRLFKKVKDEPNEVWSDLQDTVAVLSALQSKAPAEYAPRIEKCKKRIQWLIDGMQMVDMLDGD